MQLLVLPFIILNMLAGLVGGAAMLFQGEWTAFFLGLAWMLVGAFALSLALVPGMIFLPIVKWAAERESMPLMLIAGIPAMIWTYVVIAISCVVVFAAIINNSGVGLFQMLWGYAAATGPWSFLARKDAEAGNDQASMPAFFSQLGVIAMMVVTFINPDGTDFFTLIYWFAPVLGIGLVLQLFVLWVETKNARRGYW
ncbi:hypothetical protein [Erythrobacter sp. HL-111]|uniref:hypothetical protein n=1 Tax=Erythrobacter sp. HL-111 TaxID=1798193 RepID=UPI0012FB1FA3|nr:hypothetical protein [Erythrobacter sp. HL-111]